MADELSLNDVLENNTEPDQSGDVVTFAQYLALCQKIKDLEHAIADIRLALVQREPVKRQRRARQASSGNIDLDAPSASPTAQTPMFPANKQQRATVRGVMAGEIDLGVLE
jgi:hypothetical protein